MCAIAGLVGLPVKDHIAKKLLDTMQRRGPDENGICQQEECTLLHSRLAVIDPANGKQPMTRTAGQETYTLVYNGELYNTSRLRRELEKLGRRFTEHSDTEVLLWGYIQWGEQVLERLNGIFAFAVWHHNEKKLFVARDRMGVKPLFYKCHDGGFLFASELKTVLAYPTVKAELDADGAGEILLLGPGRTPGSGVFRGICELEPGCCGSYVNHKWNWKRYWKLTDREHTHTFAETVEQVRYLVTDSIRRQTVSDVPLGTFLSGGLDSSIITAVCARQAGENLSTFSVDYANNAQYFTPGKFQPNSDNSYIELMEQYLHTDHTWTVLTPEQLVEDMENATMARDLPGMADVDFSLLAFCRQIRKKVTVALSGECADEIFGGYPWYRDPEVRSADGFPWAQNTRQRAAMMAPWLTQHLDAQEFVNARYGQTLLESDILPGTSPQERRMKEMVNLNHRWFMQTLLDRKDRMSMFHGLEVRVPFCDYRIAEYLYGVPWEMKDHGGMEKGLLREAVTGILPPQVLYRKKSPYPKTHDPHYLELVSGRLREVLRRPDAPIFQIVNKEELQKLLEEEHPWPWYGQLMRKPQTIAYMLQINFWMAHYGVSVLGG